MAPKKDKKKKDAVEAEPEVLSLYAKREPLPPSEPGSAAEAEGAWKACRGHFLPSLLEWDAAAVNTTEWLSPSGEPFAGGNFSAQALPKTLLAHVTSWRRLSAPTDGSAPLEEEPRAQPFPEVEDSARDADGGKDKAAASAKAKAQPAAKGGKKDDLSSARDTAKQFADLEARRASGTVPETDMCVVSDAEFKNRETALSHDEALPPVSQSIAAQMALIAEHREMLPKGSFLWELIHPQDSDGKPIYNPQGKYIVRLFAQGEWRQVLIDDVVPVGVAGAGQTAPVFPSSPLQNVIWPQLLTKAIFRAFQAELGQRGELPVVTALTGWLPFQQAPLTWDAIKSAFAYRPFCCLQATSKPDPEARQRDALMVASAQVQGQLSGRGATVVPPLAIPAQGSAAPRLSGPLLEAPLQFLVCQLGEEPQQVRLKSGHWRPRGGSPRKYVLRDGQVEHEDDDLGAEEDEDTNDEDEPLDEGDEDDDAKSGDEALASARSQAEVAQDAAAEQALEQEAQGSEPAEQPPPTWPESLPAPAMLRSEADAYHGTLAAGHWVTFDQLRQSCDSLVTYMPPGERMLKSCLDSRWASDRRQPFCPPPLHVMRLRLTPMTRQQDEEAGSEDCDGKYRYVNTKGQLQNGTGSAVPISAAYVADVEDFTLLIDHSFRSVNGKMVSQARRMEGSYKVCRTTSPPECTTHPIPCKHSGCQSARGSFFALSRRVEPAQLSRVQSALRHREKSVRPAGHLSLDAAGQQSMADMASLAATSALPEPYSISTGDVFSLRTLLAMAGGTLDDVDSEGEPLRYRGGALVVGIKYHNWEPWSLFYTQDPPEYTVSATLRSMDKFKHRYADDEHHDSRMLKALYGIYLVVDQSGELAFFDLTHSLLILTTALGLLMMSNTLTDIMALYLLPRKEEYYKHKYEHTDDFNPAKGELDGGGGADERSESRSDGGVRRG